MHCIIINNYYYFNTDCFYFDLNITNTVLQVPSKSCSAVEWKLKETLVNIGCKVDTFTKNNIPLDSSSVVNNKWIDVDRSGTLTVCDTIDLNNNIALKSGDNITVLFNNDCNILSALLVRINIIVNLLTSMPSSTAKSLYSMHSSTVESLYPMSSSISLSTDSMPSSTAESPELTPSTTMNIPSNQVFEIVLGVGVGVGVGVGIAVVIAIVVLVIIVVVCFSKHRHNVNTPQTTTDTANKKAKLIIKEFAQPHARLPARTDDHIFTEHPSGSKSSDTLVGCDSTDTGYYSKTTSGE